MQRLTICLCYRGLRHTQSRCRKLIEAFSDTAEGSTVGVDRSRWASVPWMLLAVLFIYFLLLSVLLCNTVQNRMACDHELHKQRKLYISILLAVQPQGIIFTAAFLSSSVRKWFIHMQLSQAWCGSWDKWHGGKRLSTERTSQDKRLWLLER